VPRSNLYAADFYAWANEQATLLRTGRMAEADLENIAEEIQSMGRSEKRELKNRLAVLLLHLLKWHFQSAIRTKSWQASIVEQRLRLADHLADNPSLKAQVPDAIVFSYRLACLAAVAETGLAESTFPAECPWSFDEIIDNGFWPN